MPGFESAEVLARVKNQLVPENWKVFHAQGGYFWQNIARYLSGAFALALVTALGAALVISGPLSVDDFLILALAGGCGAVSVGFVWLAIRQIGRLRTVKEQVLVVTLEGWVSYAGTRPQDTFAVAFADLVSISLHVLPSLSMSTLAAVYLQLGYNQYWNPRQYNWQIPPQFRTLDAIAQLIIQNYTRYALEHPD